jgi:hypothetical protein
MPSADSRPTVKMDRSTLSHDAVTCGGSPEVSSTAFDAQPPDLPPVCLVEAGFAVLCQLAPHRRPLHPVLVHRLAPLIHASFRPRLTTTPLRFSSPSPPPGWAGDFHPLAVEHVRHTKQKPPICIGGSENYALLMCPRYMNVPLPAPCHVNVAGVGKQSVWGLRIIACISIITLA